jgi:hypothetical protein
MFIENMQVVGSKFYLDFIVINGSQVRILHWVYKKQTRSN